MKICLSLQSKTKIRRDAKLRYLLSVIVEIVNDGRIIPVKVVYVRTRNKRKEYLCLISTGVNLHEDEIIRIYGKRWNIEFFQSVKVISILVKNVTHYLMM